ncbi:MAG: glycosyltransferase family 1 protein [Sneathiella sp.]|nr:glycosyltransferase family 1 protein [Sneathiella sp.]
MKILILTVGSRGDVQPYLALGKGLSEAGHKVSFCTCDRFRSFVETAELEFYPVRDDILDFMDSAAGRAVMEDTTNIWRAILTNLKHMKRMKPVQQGIVDDCWAAVEAVKPDLLIFHPKTCGAPSFAEKKGIPAILACPFPIFVPTATVPNIGFPTWRLGKHYNLLTYSITKFILRLATSGMIKKWRKKAGLSLSKKGLDFLKTASGDDIPILHLYSEQVCTRPDDWPKSATVTGYCFLDRTDNWTPPTELVKFLEAGPPPVYVGFGSMAGRNPKKLGDTVIDALAKANCRGIIATSWGGMDVDDLPETIFKLEDAPHDWLFPRMSAVIHHGGAGTTAAGLRAGKPTIICSFFGDQPFWGARIDDLGVGVGPLPQKSLTADMLADAIEKVTGTEEMQRRSEELGSLIRNEDGLAKTIQQIEKIASFHPGQDFVENMS